MNNQRRGQLHRYDGCTPQASDHHQSQEWYSIDLFHVYLDPKVSHVLLLERLVRSQLAATLSASATQ
jgi:hypothetical protein